MNWLMFVTQVLKSVAWPVTVIVLVLLLRQEVFEALKEIKRFKWKGVEVEFAEKVLKAKAEAAKVVPEVISPISLKEHEDLESRLLSLLIVSPKAAVLDAWVEVERELVALLRRHNISFERSGSQSPLLTTDHLRRLQILSGDEIWLFNSLRQLRNSAAHGFDREITEESGLDYLSMATGLIHTLRGR